MNKKINTILFIIGASLFNIIVTVGAFLSLWIGYLVFLNPLLPEGAESWSYPLLFIASIAVSFVVYHLTLKLLMKKFDMEKYIDPIFNGRKYR